MLQFDIIERKRDVVIKTSVFITIICLNFAMLLHVPAHAFDLDETVDDEIRKNYNDSKLINDTGMQNYDENLPELPKIINNKSTPSAPDIKTKANTNTNTTPPPAKIVPYTGGNTKVKKGTVFHVTNSTAISDWQSRGTTVKFKLNKQLSNKNYTIPAGTIFNGEIIEVHKPQITCNGGLVAIRIYSMIYKGQTVPLNAYVTRANDKKIFFNDIKGERTYLKTMWKKGNWGRNLFNSMVNLTVKLGAETSTVILSPFPFLYGSLCLGANALFSPITAFFSKGGHVSIPANSRFNLKLNETIYID